MEKLTKITTINEGRQQIKRVQDLSTGDVFQVPPSDELFMRTNVAYRELDFLSLAVSLMDGNCRQFRGNTKVKVIRDIEIRY